MAVTKHNICEDAADDIAKVASGAGISFIGSIAGKCLWFVCQVIIARSFGAEVFGLYILGLVVLKFSGLLARLGLHAGAMRFVSIYRNDNPSKVKGTIISATLISFINGILIGGIVYVSAGFIAETIFHNPVLTDIIKTFAVCIPFISTITIITTVSRGFQTTKYSVYIKDIIQPSVNIVLIILFILLEVSFFWIVNAYVISHLIALLAGFCFVARQFPGIKERTLKPIYETKKLLNYSAPLLFNGFLIFLIVWTDKIMLGCMKTVADVGIYCAATQIPLLLLLVLRASTSIYAPSVAEMHHQNQMKRLERLFKTTTRWVFLLTLPATIILIFSAREVMTIFGSEYVKVGAPVLIVLGIAQFINCITGGVASTLSMTGKQHIEMSNSLVMVIINIILNYFLIPMYGSLGAAIATGVSIVSINLIRLLEVYIIYKIHPYNMGYIHGIASGIITVIILHLLGNHMPVHSNVMGFSLNTLVVGVIFVTSFFIMGRSDEDRFLFDRLMNKFNFKMHISKILMLTNAKGE